jgi:hypothetical protein
MLSVLLKLIRVDNYVIQIGYAELIEVFAKHVIDMALESCRSIDLAKRNDGVLVMTVASTKGGLPLVSGGYPEPMISRADVKLRKIASTG